MQSLKFILKISPSPKKKLFSFSRVSLKLIQQVSNQILSTSFSSQNRRIHRTATRLRRAVHVGP